MSDLFPNTMNSHRASLLLLPQSSYLNLSQFHAFCDLLKSRRIKMEILSASSPGVEVLKTRVSSIEAWRLPQELGTLAPPGVASNKGTTSPISASGPLSHSNLVL